MIHFKGNILIFLKSNKLKKKKNPDSEGHNSTHFIITLQDNSLIMELKVSPQYFQNKHINF